MNTEIKDELLRILIGLTKDELYEANKMVVAQIRVCRRVEDVEKSKRYKKGEPVSFSVSFGQILKGVIEKVNRKSLVILVREQAGEIEVHRVEYENVVGV